MKTLGVSFALSGRRRWRITALLQVQKLAPVGVCRVEEAVHGIFADFGSIGLKIAEQVLAGEDQAEDKPHHRGGRDSGLLDHVALLQ